MGHSVNSVGYRLSFHKNWKFEVVSRPSYYPTILPNLDLFLNRFFRQLGGSFLYSHFLLSGSSVGGELSIKIFFYNQVWQRFLRFLYRRYLRRRTSRFKSVSLPSARYFRFFKWQLEQSILFLLSPLLSKNFCSFKTVSVFLTDSPPLTPPLLARYILHKLKRRYSLARVLNSFLHMNFRLLSKSGVIGVFFRAAGRFSKTQRASTLVVKKGKTPFSTISTFVDQFALSVNLKYGTCNLVVWVAYAN